MNTPILHFLGWDAPAIELVANKLLRLNETEPTTFRHATVVVPTAESGRRLREYMAEKVGKPLLMPRITQATKLVTCAGGLEEASEYAAWIRVLSQHDAQASWPTLFPTKPTIKLNWSRGMAQRLMQLRRQLEAACLTPQLIRAGLHEAEARESLRWEEMGAIFDLVDEQIREWGYSTRQSLYDAEAARVAHLYRDKLLITACLPQITEQVRKFLDDVLQVGGKVEVYIHAPEEKQHLFDSRYGTPLNDWIQEDIDIPDELICVTANGEELATQALAACRNYEPKDITLGNCDSGFAPVLRNAFSYAGWPLNMPEGRSFLSTEAGQLPPQLLRAVLHGNECYATEQLLRNQALQRSLRMTPAMQHIYCLWLDNAMQKQMPATMSDLLALASKETKHEFILSYTESVQELLTGLKDSALLPDTLTELGLRLEKAYSGGEYADAMKEFAATTAAVAKIIRRVPEFCQASEALSMLQALVQQQACDTMGLVATKKHETALDASGWLELPFCPGKKLILCGLHENCVPESPSIDAFLPESLCRKYPQLPDMEQRTARDSFLLTALLHAYGENTCILTAKTTDDGTPLVPSRLLLRCPDDTLLQRVAALFREIAPRELPKQLATWQMRTPLQQVAELESIDLLGNNIENPWQDKDRHFSPSRLASFLSCPLRFWLKSLLNMDPQDTYEQGKSACNPAEYGTILHKVLELLVGQYPVHTPELTAERIYQTAKKLLEEQFESRFGEKLSMPLLAQMNMMDGSLRMFAEQHLADLLDGWECVLRECHTEQCEEGEKPWMFEGDAVFHMTIDRVDRKPHPDGSGFIWRIIDYKTGDYTPQKKHLDSLANESLEAFCRYMPDFPLLHEIQETGKTQKKLKESFYRWKELQLPLYAQWLMDTQHINLQDIEVGYYLLPRKTKECKYAKWQISEEQQESAMLWTRNAIRLIRNGLCLVSAESLHLTAYSDFGALAPNGDPRTMMGLPELTM